MMTTLWEWVVEYVDAYGDILDCHYLDNVADALAMVDADPDADAGIARIDFGLSVRLDWNDGYCERGYAYTDANGNLPETTVCAYGRPVREVTKAHRLAFVRCNGSHRMRRNAERDADALAFATAYAAQVDAEHDSIA